MDECTADPQKARTRYRLIAGPTSLTLTQLQPYTKGTDLSARIKRTKCLLNNPYLKTQLKYKLNKNINLMS